MSGTADVAGGTAEGAGGAADDPVADLLERFDLTNSVTHLLRRAHTRADALFDEVMCTGELTPRQTALLVASHQHPGATMA
ncbi:MAG: hypothetical protein ACYC0H_14585, partial [Solirubrobacteraceae bacterium]